jgi:tetratricopeptide (TPR) repeat protein
MPVSPVPDLPSRVQSETPEEQVVFSRVVRMTVRQILEIPFSGTGWVYLGELGNRRGIVYDSRKLDIEAGITVGQSFVFRAELPGTYILKFYKQDFIQDYIINDYVQVIVGEAYESSPGLFGERSRIVAEPRWPPVAGSARPLPVETAPERSRETVVPERARETAAPETSGGTTQAPALEPRTPVEAAGEASAQAAPSAQSTPQTDSGFSRDTPPDEYVRRAKQEFDAGRLEQALTILDLMKQFYPLGTDEALWLYGQLLEASSPSRDIRLALEYYRRLVREYPQSNRVEDARRRIAYLERYYFGIR